ncbi:DUF3887 domain-containing protein [bacterium]|nr:DUF3887 domain-containing protein [bacterium]
MNKKYSIILIILLIIILGILFLPRNSKITTDEEIESMKKEAEEFVLLMMNGEYKAANEKIILGKRKLIKAEKIETNWREITSQYGELKKISRMEYFRGSLAILIPIKRIHVILDFERGRMFMNIYFNNDNKISGFGYGNYGYKKPST